MAFDLGEALADALAGVSKSDTGREQIEYIDLSLIYEDPENFYSLTGIEDLAANIATCGLQQPIRVRRHPEEDGHYIIVSGHRRFAALEMLVKDDTAKWSEAPCIVQQENISPELQQLQLIYANAHTRELSSADKMEQAQQVEELLYKLKEQGYEFPGRMREHVAAACKVSSTKLARLKMIQEHLTQNWMLRFKKNELNESVAYELSRMAPEWQDHIYYFFKRKVSKLNSSHVSHLHDSFDRISEFVCEITTESCAHSTRMMQKCVRDENWWNHCRGCCKKCDHLKTCQYSCKNADCIKRRKIAAENKSQKDAADKEEARRLVEAAYVQLVYGRVASAMKAAGIGVKEYYDAVKLPYATDTEEIFQQRIHGENIDLYCSLPFASYFSQSYAHYLVAAADALNCSIDFLLGHDLPGAGTVAPLSQQSDSSPVREIAGGWRTGEPEEPGKYVVLTRLHAASNDFFADGRKWDGFQWERPSYDDRDVVCWMPFPEEE